MKAHDKEGQVAGPRVTVVPEDQTQEDVTIGAKGPFPWDPNLFAAMRAAVTTLWGADLALAVWQASDSILKIASQHPITQADRERLESEIVTFAPLVGLSPPPLETQVDGVSIRNMDGRERTALIQTLTMPVKVHGIAAGVACVGAFARLWTPLQTELLQQRAKTAGDTVQFLWSLVGAERDLYRRLLNRSLEGYILCDWHKQILYHNRSALQLLGLPAGGGERRSLARGMERFGLVDFIDEAIQHGLAELNKIFSTGERRERIVGVNLTRLKEHDGEKIGWLFSLRDVTAAWEVDRMKSMLSMVSHEINTPLASVQNAAELLLDGDVGEVNDKQTRCLEMIRGDVVRLRHLLRDLLELSVLDRKDTNLDRRRSVKLSYIANKVADSFEWAARERQIDLRVQVPTRLPNVRGDRDRITQVLVNLVDNALRFTPEGGRVEVGAEEKPGEIVLWVRDTGVGIAAEDLKRIFDNFEQAENQLPEAERGYGLGLSIAKEIVQRHRGRIWAESQVGEGSTFYVSLPK